MLPAVMILLVGVTTAQVPSTTMAPPRLSLEQTTIGISETETLFATSNSATLTETILSPATLSVQTIFTTRKTAVLKETSQGLTSTTPAHSTFLSPKSTTNLHPTTSMWVSSPTSPVPISTYPASTRKATERDSRRLTPLFSTESSLKRTLEVPTTHVLQSSHTTNKPIMGSRNSEGHTSQNILRDSASIHPSLLIPDIVHQPPTRSSSQNPPFQRRNNDTTNGMTVPTASFKSAMPLAGKETTTEQYVIRNPPRLETNKVQSSASTMQTNLNREVKTVCPSALTPPSIRRETTVPVKTKTVTTKIPILTSLPLLIPTMPLPHDVQKDAEMPPNVVEPMYSLPWVNLEATSSYFENEWDNVLHPTLPSVFSRRPTKPLKSGRPRIVERATTVTSNPATTIRPNNRNLDNYTYKISFSSKATTSKSLQTTVQTSPVLKLLGSQSKVPTTPVPNGGAATNNSEVSLIVPSLPSKSSDGNQSLLYSAFSIEHAPVNISKIYHFVPSFTAKTSDGNYSTFPVVGASNDTAPVPHNVPLEINSRNQSVIYSAFPIGSAVKGNPKLLVGLPPLPQKTGTETLPPVILPTLAAMGSVVENETQNCTNDYCVSDEDYLEMMLDYIFPTSYEWVLIGMHIVVFIGGLVGNALVCVAVYRNHSMRTVTNYFIVNLAVADFLVILLCLPPSVLWDVTETWFMGTALCKIVLYFQTVSVAVSVLTLTFISIDRWYAICCPLKFKSTTGRAKTAILIIWVLALAFDIPELVVLQTKRKELSIDTLFFTQCEPSWSDKTDMAFHCLQTLLLYTIPLVFMSIAYCQIVRVLWSSSNIPGHKERLNSSVSTAQAASCRSDTTGRKKKINRCTSVTVSTTGQVLCRRKAAKMLVAVVIMFAVCYFPVHLLSILRYTYDIPQTDATTAFAMVSHWLCYANSAVNPLIYNFMSGKFRKEFAHTFGCHRITWKRPAAFARRRRRRQDVRRQDVASSRDWCANGQCGAQRTEMVPLSGDAAPDVVLDVEIPC